MKKIFLSIFIAGLILITVGCGNNKINKNSIVGSWENKKDAVVITFEENGNGYTKIENQFYDSFLYEYKEGFLTIKYQTIMETELKYNCEIKDDVLTISSGKETYEYTRVKD